jgi:nitrogen fixation/metabolism regulation signal transduction histidine kinase
VSEVSRMNIHDLAGDSPELLAEFTKAAAERDQMIAAEQKSIQEQQTMLLGRQAVILRVLVGGMAAMVVLIGMLGIFFTHKVAGPIFKMKRLLADVGRGNLRVETRLRKGDELQDFFEVFALMVEKLKDRQRREVTELDSAMEAAKGSGASDEAIDKIRRVRDEMKAALDL